MQIAIWKVTFLCLKRGTGLSFGTFQAVYIGVKVPNVRPVSLFKHQRVDEKHFVTVKHLGFISCHNRSVLNIYYLHTHITSAQFCLTVYIQSLLGSRENCNFFDSKIVESINLKVWLGKVWKEGSICYDDKKSIAKLRSIESNHLLDILILPHHFCQIMSGSGVGASSSCGWLVSPLVSSCSSSSSSASLPATSAASELVLSRGGLLTLPWIAASSLRSSSGSPEGVSWPPISSSSSSWKKSDRVNPSFYVPRGNAL